MILELLSFEASDRAVDSSLGVTRYELNGPPLVLANLIDILWLGRSLDFVDLMARHIMDSMIDISRIRIVARDSGLGSYRHRDSSLHLSEHARVQKN